MQEIKKKSRTVNYLIDTVGKVGFNAHHRRSIILLGLFDKMMRELVEMMYLTEDPVVLCGEKYASRIGSIPCTPYHLGIQNSFL